VGQNLAYTDTYRQTNQSPNQWRLSMSILVTMKMSGDTETFRAALKDRAAEFEEISARSRTVGAVHHRFGVGDGFVVVVDEWESAEQFDQFFGDPALQAFIAEIGGDMSKPPEIAISEAIESSDAF
jgi:hypothetical protein